MQDTTDGRPWGTWSTSSRKGFPGIRRVANCRGSPICQNEKCSGLAGVPNRLQFTQHKDDSAFFCILCSTEAESVPCNGKKVWEFYEDEVLVLYVGNHTCIAKRKSSKKKAEELMAKHRGLSPGQAVNKELEKCMSGKSINWEEIDKLTMEFANKKQLYNAQSFVKSSDGHGNFFDAVSLFKEETDKKDPFIVYSANNEKLNNGKPTYVFKSLKSMAQLAIDMDKDIGKYCDSFAYVDVKHDRVKGLQSVTLWTCHPIICKVMCIATMEITKENGENLILFWHQLNSMLQELSGDAVYMFNPRGWIVDEHSANWSSIAAVYGEEGIRRTFSCEFHFKQSLTKYSKKVTTALYALHYLYYHY